MTNAAYITYGGEQLPYEIRIVPDRSTKIAIHVEPDGQVIVDAPGEAVSSDIQKAVHKRARWIFAQVEQARLRFRHIQTKEYISGEEVLYLGRRYVLKVIQDSGDRQPVKLRGNRLEVNSPSGSPDQIRAKVWAWYRVKGRDYFDRRLAVWENKLTWVRSRPPFRLQEMEKRWGSCTSQGEIVLNTHLIKAPRECIDYVILHELAHLRHHHHGPEFWKTISLADPNWERKKQRLDAAVEDLMAR